MKLNQSQRGATLTEFMTIGPLIFILGMTGIQYTLMYNAKTNLTYASYEAARAGAIENADPKAIQAGLLKGFLPYLSAGNGSNGDVSDSAQLLQTITTSETPFMKVEIINPNKKAFDDFNDETLQRLLKTDHKVIPNKQTDIENLKDTQGKTSGITIEEANVLKLRITYGYKPSIPLVGNMFAQAYDLLSGPQDTFNTMLFAANRVPIVVDVSSQMLSPAVQNGLKTGSYDPGNTNSSPTGGHQLPDLTQIKLPGKYENMSREEIINDILTNGKDKSVSNKDWVKILIALGIITVGADQISNVLEGVDESGSVVNSDMFSDFQSNYQCPAGATSYDLSDDDSPPDDGSPSSQIY